MPSQETIDGLWQAASVLGFLLGMGLVGGTIYFVAICLSALAKRWR